MNQEKKDLNLTKNTQYLNFVLNRVCNILNELEFCQRFCEL